MVNFYQKKKNNKFRINQKICVLRNQFVDTSNIMAMSLSWRSDVRLH